MPERRLVWLVACLSGNAGLLLASIADYLWLASAWHTPLLWTYLIFMIGLWAAVVPWRRGTGWLRMRARARAEARPVQSDSD